MKTLESQNSCVLYRMSSSSDNIEMFKSPMPSPYSVFPPKHYSTKSKKQTDMKTFLYFERLAQHCSAYHLLHVS